MRLLAAIAAAGSAATMTAVAQSEIVFQAIADNNYIVPFNPFNWSTVTYGDGGWLTDPGSPPVTLSKITLGLATYLSNVPSTTDLVFTLTDGDPSGLLGGSGAPLYSVTIHNLLLPAAPYPAFTYFSLEIPLPNVQTLGGVNNIGWSIRLENYVSAGCFGFQLSSCLGQPVGHYTNAASFFDGEVWSLYIAGENCTGVVNYVATVEGSFAAPCPCDLDASGAVGPADLGILLGQWGSAGSADLDADGSVGATDLGMLLGAWGSCP